MGMKSARCELPIFAGKHDSDDSGPSGLLGVLRDTVAAWLGCRRVKALHAARFKSQMKIRHEWK